MATLAPGLISLIIFLLPGFAGLITFRNLCETRKSENIDSVIYALVLTGVGIGLGDWLFGIDLIPDIRIENDRIVRFSMDHITVKGLLVSSLFSVLAAVPLAVLVRFDLFHRAARFIGLSYKTGRIDVWHDVFSEHRKKWVEVGFQNGRRIVGWPKYYSVDDERRELFLENVTVITVDGDSEFSEDVVGPGVYINNFKEVQYVMLLD